jgi:hypothetical protein
MDSAASLVRLWEGLFSLTGPSFGEPQPFEEKPTPHRFRLTFGRILLQCGVPVADVADPPGDDEDTVRALGPRASGAAHEDCEERF